MDSHSGLPLRLLLRLQRGTKKEKQVYSVVSVTFFIICLTGSPYLMEEIASGGAGGVNEVRLGFPLLLSVYSFWLFKRKK